jgi:DNA-directed RNA polymerases I, II, and III subunit RPABC2
MNNIMDNIINNTTSLEVEDDTYISDNIEQNSDDNTVNDDDDDNSLFSKEEDEDDDDDNNSTSSGEIEIIAQGQVRGYEQSNKKSNDTSIINNTIENDGDVSENDGDISDDDDISEDSDNYIENNDDYQKFNSEVNKNYIQKSHPECLVNNFNEVQSLCNVIRDNNNNIIDDLHKSLPILTKYEKANILGKRTNQLDGGDTPYIKVPSNIISNYVIACMELEQKKIPIIIKRPIPNGGFEYWKLKDLEILN